jgi:hypothetical protein
MSFSIGPIKTEKGEKVQEYINVAEMPIGKVSLPVTIINGKPRNKVLLIVSGIHATEYPGIRAAQLFAQETKPEQVRGVIIILHCANPQIFNAKTAYVNPADNLNFNRIFPGKPTFEGFYGPGTISHHITSFIYSELMQKATHFIDLHSGDLPELLPFYAGGASTGDTAKDYEIKQMLKHSLAEFIVIWPRSNSLSTTGAASRLGIPNVIIEAGGAGQISLKDISHHYDAIVNIAKYLEVIQGEPVKPYKQREFNGISLGVRASRGGVLHKSCGSW